MKVLDLQCAQAHGFEGWFASEDDFAGQLSRGLLTCPLCGDGAVTKKLSAPRLNLGGIRDPSVAQQVVAGDGDLAMQAAWLALARRIVSNTEDVGERFSEEARRIHYGETAQRGIRGQASREQTESLLEEGIAVMPLALPELLKGPMQ